MLLKIKVLERLINGFNRYFKSTLQKNRVSNLVQFHSGGDDYNPPDNAEGLAGAIGDNPADGFIFAWRDKTTRKAAKGEKRLYSVDTSGAEIAEIWLKNTGEIVVSGKSVNITVDGNLTVSATGVASVSATSSATVSAPTVNLGGDGGAFVLTENSTIVDSLGGTCSITSNTTKTKAT